MDHTVRYEDLDLIDRLRLIGKTVMVGMYTRSKTEDEDVEDEYIGSVTGTLSAISEDKDVVVFSFQVNGDGDIRAPIATHSLLVTWLDETVSA